MNNYSTHIITFQETNKEEIPQYKVSAVERIFANFFSIVFHPLFLPLYVVVFIIYFHPSYFIGFSDNTKLELILTTALNTVFFPLITILIMKGLGFIKSIFLHTQQDRIGPYLSNMIFYFWIARVFFKFEPSVTLVLASFMTAVFLTTIAALIANIFYKISMHAIGCGGVIGIFIIIMFSNTMLMTWPLCFAFLMTGIVCTSRLMISNHTSKEIYSGLLVGLLCQFAAAFVIL